MRMLVPDINLLIVAQTHQCQIRKLCRCSGRAVHAEIAAPAGQQC